MLPPVDMKDSNTEWQSFDLTPKEIDLKQVAIKQYRTQIDVMEPFLMAFVRKPNYLLQNLSSLFL